MGYKQDVLVVQVGATIWMCYENDVLGRQVGATKKICYEKDVFGKNRRYEGLIPVHPAALCGRVNGDKIECSLSYKTKGL